MITLGCAYGADEACPVWLTPSQQSFPDLQPLYDAARSYLEIPQRVDLLNARVEVRVYCASCQVFNSVRDSGHCQQVLQDMLRLLKESASSRHAERLEQIVIALIGVEIGMRFAFPSHHHFAQR